MRPCCPCRKKPLAAVQRLEDRGLACIPRSVLAHAESLSELWLHQNNITEIPPSLAKCGNLELLYINGNNISKLDDEVASQWVKLQELNLSANPAFSDLPLSAKKWKDLRQIYLNDLPLFRSIGPCCLEWARLKVLHVNKSGLVDLGQEIGALVSLTQVSICGNPHLKRLPEEIGKWTSLEKLFLNDNGLETLPKTIGELASLTRLYANNNKLESLPESVGALSQLQELYVADNHLRSLPSGISNCTSLGKLFAPRNQLTSLPQELPSSLELLNLSSNRVVEVPAALICTLCALKFLHLPNNQLEDFPFSSLQSPELRIFDVSAGNEKLAKARGAEIAKVYEGLVKPWVFDAPPKEQATREGEEAGEPGSRPPSNLPEKTAQQASCPDPSASGL